MGCLIMGIQEEFETLAKRPIDCEESHINIFINMVDKSHEVPLANLMRGVPMAEMLFFTVNEEKLIVGVSAIRFPNQAYHKHLFNQAGVPEMYNPYSVESCWLSVRERYRGKGVWSSNRQARLDYLGDRPCHVVRRADNKNLNMSKSIYAQAGTDFYSDTSEDKLMLLTYNHDPVCDPDKRLIYGLRGF